MRVCMYICLCVDKSVDIGCVYSMMLVGEQPHTWHQSILFKQKIKIF